MQYMASSRPCRSLTQGACHIVLCRYQVILATNIAETSITVEDVVYVVDSGKQRETRYDPHKGMTSLVEAWVSAANIRQRAGRAGRVRPGQCFALLTREHAQGRLRAYQQPEIQRVPLLELCLQIKLLHLGTPQAFLEKARPHPAPFLPIYPHATSASALLHP